MFEVDSVCEERQTGNKVTQRCTKYTVQRWYIIKARMLWAFYPLCVSTPPRSPWPQGEFVNYVCTKNVTSPLKSQHCYTLSYIKRYIKTTIRNLLSSRLIPLKILPPPPAYFFFKASIRKCLLVSDFPGTKIPQYLTIHSEYY